ncbi:MAG: CapA family protein [Gammaproteobacteria bacterium]|nr:CapA family protein [Gammaproteobacteria bacterium]
MLVANRARYWSGICVLALLAAGCSRTLETAEPIVDSSVGQQGTPGATVKPAQLPEPTPEQLARQRADELSCARITVAAVGDIMLGTDFPENRLPDDDGRSLLAEVAPVFSSTNITFGNLEGVLMDGGEPVKTCKDPSACYLFRTPTHYAGHLADAGFTVMSLANNHARDFGEAGRTASMASLDAAGIRHSGRTGDLAIWPDGKIKTALIAFAPFTNSNPMLDLDAARNEIAKLKEMVDLIIVSFHGGAEGAEASHVPFASETYFGENRGNVVEFSHAMIDTGADLVIGHGPHVPRALETYNGRLIAYSLGNFATYYGISIHAEKGLAPILIVTVDGNGQFISGEIVSAIQQRPFGPRLDDRHRAYERIWELTEQDFAGGGIRFQNGGSFFPASEPETGCQQDPGQPVLQAE